MSKDFKNSLEKDIKSTQNYYTETTEEVAPYKGAQSVSPQTVESMPFQENTRIHMASQKRDKYFKIFGGAAIAMFIATMIIGFSTPDTTDAAKNALETRVSTTLSAGTILLSEDENTTPQDYTINHSFGGSETKIRVWDYEAEDGDYVQVLMNGTPISDAFMIKHKPKEFIVPSTGDVQIKGIKDGGGGITYAIYYDLNGTSYFNSASEGKFNTYTLIRN